MNALARVGRLATRDEGHSQHGSLAGVALLCAPVFLYFQSFEIEKGNGAQRRSWQTATRPTFCIGVNSLI
jgi:hypothetical protein